MMRDVLVMLVVGAVVELVVVGRPTDERMNAAALSASARLPTAFNTLRKLATLCATIKANDLLNAVKKNYGPQLKAYGHYNGSSEIERHLGVWKSPGIAIDNCYCLTFNTAKWSPARTYAEGTSPDAYSHDPIYVVCKMRSMCAEVTAQMRAAFKAEAAARAAAAEVGTPRPPAHCPAHCSHSPTTDGHSSSDDQCPDWAGDVFASLQSLKTRINQLPQNIRDKMPAAVEWFGDAYEGAKKQYKAASKASKSVLEYIGERFWLLSLAGVALTILEMASICRCRLSCRFPCCSVSCPSDQIIADCPKCLTSVTLNVNNRRN